MIAVEGYRAFAGTMRITPKCAGVEPFELTGDWLYKPEFDCWYGLGRSFPAEICTVLNDEGRHSPTSDFFHPFYSAPKTLASGCSSGSGSPDS